MLFLSVSHLRNTPPLPLELRLDLFETIDFEELKKFLQTKREAVMFTARSGEKELIWRLLELKPEYFDLEWDRSFAKEAIEAFPDTKFVISYHNFIETPTDLEGVYRAMIVKGAFGYKIGAMARSSNDALRLLAFCRKYPNLSGIPMGEKGAFGRILGPILGNPIGFAKCGTETGPGQLSQEELFTIYRYPLLSKTTKIYGLIGDPVEKSFGHIYHNKVFERMGIDAVYVKISVKKEELDEFIALAKEIGIRGLSVTIPLKEEAVRFIDNKAPMGAVNTLLFESERILGANTDGVGALDALEEKIGVRQKKLVVAGAGGTARAVAFEAKQRGAEVFMYNRTHEKAMRAANELECAACENEPTDYDAIVNCTPSELPFVPKAIAMDVNYFPKETAFLKIASEKGYPIVYGEEMFLNQAARQTIFWNGDLEAERLKQLCLGKKTAILADQKVSGLYGKALAEQLGADLIAIGRGESVKTLQTVERLVDELAKRGFGRDCTLVALGGGATTDLVGFIASIYMRGVDLILVPTTLLAMVDAAIGGKTAVNTHLAKNLIGTFYPPRAILRDFKALQTLPEKEWQNGVAEIEKLGLVWDSSLWREKVGKDLIEKAAKAKMEVVDRDPTEKSVRRILNFGHTIGHGLEAVANFEMAHGEAVAIGCHVESFLSRELGYLEKRAFDEIDERYSKRKLQLPKGYSREIMLQCMRSDKKRGSGSIRFVCIDAIGHALEFNGEYCRPVSDLDGTLEWMEKKYG